jgi:hypothetical protein
MIGNKLALGIALVEGDPRALQAADNGGPRLDSWAFSSSKISRRVRGIRHFVGWYDETPRDQMRRELLVEINLALDTRPDAHGLTAA